MCNPEILDMYEVVANEIPVGLWQADENGIIFFENHKIKQFYGESKLGQHYSTLAPIALTEDFHEFKTRIGNKEKWFHITVHSCKDQHMGTITDVTNEKTLLQQLINFKKEMMLENLNTIK